jgi:prepilin-type N-terminal cleavage/methylation domain-containing protein
MAIINIKKFKNSVQSGVTLIELIVVIVIFSIISSVLLFNYSDFSTNVSIRNLSQDIALTVRKVQTYATSVQSINNSGVDTRTFPSYGISFSLDDTSGSFDPNKKRFVVFADIPSTSDSLPNKLYDNNGVCGSPAVDSECLESFTINSSDTIVEVCTDVTGCVAVGSVDITFRRPVPDAIICYKETLDADCQTSSISYVDIVLRSAKGLTRKVSVWNTGQISVK